MCMSDILLAHYTMHIQKVNLNCQSDSLSSREWCYDCFRSRPSTQAGAFKIDCWHFCPTLFLFLAPPQRNNEEAFVPNPTQCPCLPGTGEHSICWTTSLCFWIFWTTLSGTVVVFQKCSCCQVQNYMVRTSLSLIILAMVQNPTKKKGVEGGVHSRCYQVNFTTLVYSELWTLFAKGGRDWKCH